MAKRDLLRRISFRVPIAMRELHHGGQCGVNVENPGISLHKLAGELTAFVPGNHGTDAWEQRAQPSKQAKDGVQDGSWIGRSRPSI